MFKLRIHISAILVLCSLVCAVWALPPLTGDQQKAKAKCDGKFNTCFQNCGSTYANNANLKLGCQNGCIDLLAKCYGQIGIKAPPRNQLTNGKVPQGTLTQASPTATPKGGVRQPQGTLMQASPTATPSTKQPNSLAPLKKTTPTPTPTPHRGPSTSKKSDGH